MGKPEYDINKLSLHLHNYSGKFTDHYLYIEAARLVCGLLLELGQLVYMWAPCSPNLKRVRTICRHSNQQGAVQRITSLNTAHNLRGTPT